MEEAIIKHVFERPYWINNHYMPGLILIADVDGKDVVIYKDGNIGFYNDFSELIDGKIAGGLKYKNDYYGIVSFKGNVWEEPEWHITTWDYGETTDDITIKDDNKGWFILGKSTNYKMVPESLMEK